MNSIVSFVYPVRRKTDNFKPLDQLYMINKINNACISNFHLIYSEYPMMVFKTNPTQDSNGLGDILNIAFFEQKNIVCVNQHFGNML